MGGHYEKGMYGQLMDVMAKLDALEAEHKKDRKEIKTLSAEVSSLRKENAGLRDKVNVLQEENAALKEKCGHWEKECCLLHEDNERLKNIQNNNSSNTSNLPSTDQKGGKPANTYNGRKKMAGKRATRKAIRAAHLPKRPWKKRYGAENAFTK